MNVTEVIEAIRKRLLARTPGVLRVEPSKLPLYGPEHQRMWVATGNPHEANIIANGLLPNDAEFFSGAPGDIEALIGIVERQRNTLACIGGPARHVPIGHKARADEWERLAREELARPVEYTVAEPAPLGFTVKRYTKARNGEVAAGFFIRCGLIGRGGCDPVALAYPPEGDWTGAEARGDAKRRGWERTRAFGWVCPKHSGK